MILECFLVKNLVICICGHGLKVEPESIYLVLSMVTKLLYYILDIPE